jgi:hypothetical protein
MLARPIILSILTGLNKKNADIIDQEVSLILARSPREFKDEDLTPDLDNLRNNISNVCLIEITDEAWDEVLGPLRSYCKS